MYIYTIHMIQGFVQIFSTQGKISLQPDPDPIISQFLLIFLISYFSIFLFPQFPISQMHFSYFPNCPFPPISQAPAGVRFSRVWSRIFSLFSFSSGFLDTGNWDIGLSKKRKTNIKTSTKTKTNTKTKTSTKTRTRAMTKTRIM